MAIKFLVRTGSAASWHSANPTLGLGEMAYESDTRLYKFGDSATAYNDLKYSPRAVHAHYAKAASAQTLTTANTNYVLNFDSKVEDTDNAVTVGSAWKFTAPVAGVYQVACSYVVGPAAYTTSTQFYALLSKNGNIVVNFQITPIGSGASMAPVTGGVATIRLAAGDYISVLAVANVNSVAIPNGATQTWIMIDRIGN